MSGLVETTVVMVPQVVEYQPSLMEFSARVGQPNEPAAFVMVVGKRDEDGNIVSGSEKSYRWDGDVADLIIRLIREGQVVGGVGKAAGVLGLQGGENLNDAANLIYAIKKAELETSE